MNEYNKYDKNEMLIEQTSVRQHNGEPFRRIFFSKMAQIDIWYEHENCKTILGTQITYDERQVITAINGKPVSYTITEVENTIKNQSAILKENDNADINQIENKLVSLINQLPEKESTYAKNIILEIKKNNYVNYPII